MELLDVAKAFPEAHQCHSIGKSLETLVGPRNRYMFDIIMAAIEIYILIITIAILEIYIYLRKSVEIEK